MKINFKAPSAMLGWTLIMLGILGLGASLLVKHNQAKPPANVSVRPGPSSDKPSAASIASYSVPPTQPKFIAIPAIHVAQTRVIALGVLKNGDIATPDNIYDAGWYNGSSRPGQGGAMFIYGHVSNLQANGVFFDLKDLKAGNAVTVTRGDNQTYNYRVVSSKIYPYNHVDMKQVLTPVQSDKPGLSLMTCAGNVNKATGEFSERLVVFASLAK